MATAAICVILGQVIITGCLAWFVRTFGQYTDATLKAHESNLLVYRQSMKILEHAQSLIQQEKSA